MNSRDQKIKKSRLLVSFVTLFISNTRLRFSKDLDQVMTNLTAVNRKKNLVKTKALKLELPRETILIYKTILDDEERNVEITIKY